VLDVRPLYYVSPLTEQEIGPITPVIRLRNLADEDATVTGLFRIYRDSTGLLEYSSDLAVTPLAHGTSADIPALTPFSPGAVADDDYFVICELEYRSIQTGNVTRGNLGPFYFDTKAPPMGPVPAGHHPTHENAGMDEIDLAGMSGLLADPQTPETHAGTHEDGQADEVNVAGLHGELADDQPALAHDIAGARHTSTATPAQLLKADANGLPVDATNTDADVAAAVGASHAQNTDTDLEAVFEATLEKVANKGAAGGYCGLPNPLDATLPLRADGTPARPVGLFVEHDLAFIQTNSIIGMWRTVSLVSGSIPDFTGDANHPGKAGIVSGGSANSGYRVCTFSVAFLIAGSEKSDIILRPKTLAGAIVRAGFLDTSDHTAPSNGAYLEMNQVAGVDGTLVGKTAAGGARTTTATSFLLVTNTWYRLRVEVNTAANLVTFTCFSEAGAVLWTDTTNANVPTAAGQETGHGFIATKTTLGGGAICDLDYINIEIARALVR
jgi:hypothetical protein